MQNHWLSIHVTENEECEEIKMWKYDDRIW